MDSTDGTTTKIPRLRNRHITGARNDRNSGVVQAWGRPVVAFRTVGTSVECTKGKTSWWVTRRLLGFLPLASAVVRERLSSLSIAKSFRTKT